MHAYADDGRQRRKMAKRYGFDAWHDAVEIAADIHLAHGNRECMAVLVDMVVIAIDGSDKA